MSSDLLADLDDFYQPAHSTQSQARPAAAAASATHANDFLDFGSWGEPQASTAFSSTAEHLRVPQKANASIQVDDDFGDFGDFEFADSLEAPAVASCNVSNENKTSANLSDIASAPSAVGHVEIQTYFPRPSPLHVPSKQKKPRPVTVKAPRDESVFFDAEEDHDEEDVEEANTDFGDFAESTTTAEYGNKAALQPPSTTLPRPSVPRQVSLLDFDDEPVAAPSTAKQDALQTDFDWDVFEAPKATIIPMRQRPHTLHASVPSRDIKANPTPLPQAELVKSVNDDAWDDFEEAQPVARHVPTMIAPPDRSISAPPLQLPSMLELAQAPFSSSMPPSNIPPPSSLLPLFPPLITQAQRQLFDHLVDPANTSFARTAILTHPTTRTFLTAYISIATVLARILAGRKLRWKRDTALTQSMRIGPASASGKSGGMKLTGVDKGEVAKEDREVGEVLRLWRNQLGRLRSAVTGAGPLPPIPEISETMVVRTAKEVEGGVPAAKQCLVCGLKRNERVAKVDFQVDDMFNEWWIEHWGHKTCVAFWRVNEDKLRSR